MSRQRWRLKLNDVEGNRLAEQFGEKESSDPLKVELTYTPGVGGNPPTRATFEILTEAEGET